jgi:DNA-binding SARP family transcriptional activator
MFPEVRFEVLGPVRAWHGKTELDLGSPQQRALLAMLLLARGRQVSLDGLVDGLWDEHVPKAATGTIRTYVSRLRRILDLDAGGQRRDPIESIGDGYLLRVGPALLDLDVFEHCLDEARAARKLRDTAGAARLLGDALGLWHGAALAGVPGPYAESRRVPLTELHLAATEEKLDADICLGEHTAAISELRVLLAEHPFRERLTELLMTALYKSGRQAEALGAFDSMRRRLRDELGIDPGPALRTLHQRVLEADRRLTAPCAATAAAQPAQAAGGGVRVGGGLSARPPARRRPVNAAAIGF